MNRFRCLLIFIIVLPAANASGIRAAEGERQQRMQALARSFEFRHPSADVAMVDRSLFSWSTPERQAIGGELYLWTHRGRPLATIGIWTYDDVSDSFELQSLSEDPIHAESDRADTWNPQVGGLEFAPLPGAPRPEGSALRRQTQMRSFVRNRFSAEIVRRDTQQPVSLRLLAQPLYRYELLPDGVIDGAMFAFAMGTDPEVLVLFEAREIDGNPVWYFALAPSTSVPARGYLDQQQIWDNDDQLSNGTFRMVINR